MRKIMSLTILLLGLCTILNAQETPDVGCTPSHERAVFAVQYYLTAPHLADERVKAGTNNIPVEQIKHVDNLIECAKLDSVLNSNPRFKEINETAKRTKFYYQTNDFYYIFWREVVKNVFLGPKAIFIVVKKQNKQVYECYI